jgi:peptide/nickel transport system substrate-binding protein
MLVVALLLVLASCAAPPPTQTARAPEGVAPQAAAREKHIVIATIGDPPSFYRKFNSPGVRGGDGIEQLVNAGLTQLDGQQRLAAQLAEAVPGVESGSWRLGSDGTMETTWRIRDTARWHDGTPVSSDDAAFTIAIWRDDEFPTLRDPAYAYIDEVRTPDPRTIVVTWRRPYIHADALFNAPLLPAHILTRPYDENKAGFLDLRYWSLEFVGTGPYRVIEWELSQYARLQANESYLLGRPRIDRIEVRFLLDSNVLIAGLLAGTFDLTLARTLTSEQGIEVRNQWPAGVLLSKTAGWYLIHPQFVNPTPPVVLDARLRNAMWSALDRQQMADSIGSGLAPVADVIIGPDEPEYHEVERFIVRHPYDQRQALSLLEQIGYRAGGGGAVVDAAGQQLTFETTTTFDPLNQKILFAAADDWKRLGLGISTTVIPAQLVQNQELRAKFPAFEAVGAPNGADALNRVYSTQARIAERNYTGNNNANYMSPELDALLNRFFTTIPWDQRMEAAGQIVQHMTSQAVWLGLFYRIEPTLVSKRMRNVTPGPQGFTQAWNAQEWDTLDP